MAELADAQDLKSCVPLGTCGFESRSGYFFCAGGEVGLRSLTQGGQIALSAHLLAEFYLRTEVA